MSTDNRGEQMSLIAGQEELERGGEYEDGEREKNWPAWPKPLLHHDIQGDIPRELQGLVRQAYLGWWLFLVACSWNCMTILATLFVHIHILPQVFCWLWLVVLVPTAFVVYLVLYNAARKRSSFRYCIYMCLDCVFIFTLIFFA